MAPVSNEPPPRAGQLGLWDTVSIIIGIVIGTTVFYVPWLIFLSVDNPFVGLLIWTVGGVLALVGALCYAELATTYPRAGGDYVYLTRAFGPWAGFLFGWAQLTMLLTASIGIMAVVFGEYAVKLELPNLAQRLDVDISPDVLYGALAVVALSLLNILGVTMGKLAQNLLTVAKVLGLLAIIVAGFAWGEPDHLLNAPLPETAGDWKFQALAVILVLYAYGGWNDAAFVAAEVRNQRRNLPRALLLATAVITLIYLLVNSAYLLGLGFDGVRASRTVPADLLARTPLEENGAKAISILIMVSALGAANGLILTGTRVYATLGADYRLFAWLGTWRPGRGSPIVAVLLQAIIAVGLLAAFGTPRGHELINDVLTWFGITPGTWTPYGAFDSLLAHTAPAFWFFFLLTGLSLFVLRERDKQLPRPFPVPLYPALPLVFCSMCLYMLYSSIDYIKVRALLAFAVLWVGVLLFMLARLFGTRGMAADTAAPPGDEDGEDYPAPARRRPW
jgi:amino acid transporter